MSPIDIIEIVLNRPPSVKNVVFIAPAKGSGKTTLAYEAAKENGLFFVDADMLSCIRNLLPYILGSSLMSRPLVELIDKFLPRVGTSRDKPDFDISSVDGLEAILGDNLLDKIDVMAGCERWTGRSQPADYILVLPKPCMRTFHLRIRSEANIENRGWDEGVYHTHGVFDGPESWYSKLTQLVMDYPIKHVMTNNFDQLSKRRAITIVGAIFSESSIVDPDHK